MRPVFGMDLVSLDPDAVIFYCPIRFFSVLLLSGGGGRICYRLKYLVLSLP